MATYTANYSMIKPSLADVADIAAINQNTDKIDEIMHGSQTSLADAYDPAETYNLRDKVMHDFQLYTCLSNGTTGTWDPTKWERINAADTGGNYVDVTENYQTGLNIAVIDIDGDQHNIYAPVMEGATSQDDGQPGLVPAPTSQDAGKYLKSDGTWDNPPGGGGGGTTVIPNPQGTPTDTLNTIQIGQTVFDIPGSGGGSGGGAVNIETETIWANTTGAGAGTYTLSKSINNFDFISVRYGQWGDYTGPSPLCECQIIATKDLQQLHTDGVKIIFTGYGNRVCYADFDGATMEVSNVNEGQIVLEVNGINLEGMNVSEDLAAGDWTQLISQSGAAWSADTAIPADATHIVIVDDYQNALYMPLVFRIADLDKLADVAGHDVIYYGMNWEVGTNYDKIQYKYDAANRTIAIYAVYSGITIKAYAVKAKNAAPGGYSDEVIYTDTTGATGAQNITLTKRLDSFDAIYFEYFYPSEATYISATPSPVCPIVETPSGSTNGKYYINLYPSYGNRYITFSSPDGGTSATITGSAWGDIYPSIYKIHGIKY